MGGGGRVWKRLFWDLLERPIASRFGRQYHGGTDTLEAAPVSLTIDAPSQAAANGVVPPA